MTYRRTAQWILEIAAMCLMFFFALSMTACTDNGKPNDQEIRQKSADATRDARQAGKELAAKAKVAAANAVDGVNAAAQGVKDGVNSGKPGDSSGLVDINSASTARIAMLQGISITKARDIVKGRPYPEAHALVDRGLLTEQQYRRISPQITAK